MFYAQSTITVISGWIWSNTNGDTCIKNSHKEVVRAKNKTNPSSNKKQQQPVKMMAWFSSKLSLPHQMRVILKQLQLCGNVAVCIVWFSVFIWLHKLKLSFISWQIVTLSIQGHCFDLREVLTGLHTHTFCSYVLLQDVKTQQPTTLTNYNHVGSEKACWQDGSDVSKVMNTFNFRNGASTNILFD